MLVDSIDVGDIVLINPYGNTKFLVCRGWFTYNNTRRNGWYFKSIPKNYIVPSDTVDPEDVTILSSYNSYDCDCHPKPPRPSPCPPPVGTNENAFVTVETLEDRNILSYPYPVNGRIVRVNNVNSEVKYYIWNSSTYEWEDYEFPLNSEATEAIKQMISDIDEQKETHKADMLSVTEKLSSLGIRITEVEDKSDWVLLEG